MSPENQQVPCFACGRPADPNAAACGACGESFGGICECGAARSLYATECAACGTTLVPKNRLRKVNRWKRRVVLAVAVGGVGVAAYLSFRPDPNPPWRVRDQALHLYEARDFAGAAKLFEQLTVENPSDANAWYMLAVSYRELGFDTEAYIAPARRALAAQPAMVEALFLIAMSEVERGNVESAAALLVQAAAAPSPPAKVLAMQGEIELQRASPDLRRALDALQRAREAGVDEPWVVVRLAELQLQLLGARPASAVPAEIVAALREADRAMQRMGAGGPDASVAEQLRARIHLALGDADAAFESAEKALVRLPTGKNLRQRAETLVVRGKALHLRGNRVQAQQDFIEALQHAPDAAIALSITSFLGEDVASSEQVLTDAIAFGDPRGALRGVVAMLQHAAGKLDEAAANVAAAREASPSEALFALIQGDVFRAQSKWEDARKAYAEAAQLAPRAAAPRVRAELLAVDAASPADRSAAVRSAIERITTFRTDFPDDPEVLRTLAALHAAAGDHVQAARVIEDVLRLTPGDADLWVALARARRQGRQVDAIERAADALSRARALRPADEGLAVEEIRTLLDTGDAALAVTSANRYLHANPESAQVRRLRGDAYRRLQRWTEAATNLAAVRTALGADAARDEALLLDLIDATFRAGSAESARALVAEVLPTASPEFRDSLAVIGDLHGGDIHRAIAALEARGPSLIAARLQLMAAEPEAAIATARQLLAKDPGHAEAARLLVFALLRAEVPPDEAIVEARGVLDRLHRDADDDAREAMLGRVLLAEGDAAAAARHLARAAQLRPTDPLVHFFLGEALLRNDDPDGGIAAMRVAVRLPDADPAMPRALARRLLTVSAGSVDLRRAENLAMEAARLDPSSADAALRVSGLLRLRGDYRASAEAAERLFASHSPRSEHGAALREQAAVAWLLAGETARAEAVVADAGGEFRSRDTAQVLLGFIHFRQGRVDDAERVFAALVEPGKDVPLAVIGLVQSALSRQDPAAAMAATAAWERAHPDDRDVRAVVTRALLRQGHLIEAESVARACRDANPGDHLAVAQLTLVLARQGRTADALREAERFDDGGTARGRIQARLLAGIAHATYGGNGLAALEAAREVASSADATAGQVREAKVLEAEALLALQRDAEAQSIVSTIASEWEDDIPATAFDRALESRVRFVLGTLAAKAGNHALAIAQFERCLRFDEMNLDAANNLAWVLLQRESTLPRARELATWVTEMQPHDPNYWDTRAQAAARASDAEDAVSSWLRALEIHGATWTDTKAGVALRYAEFLSGAGRSDEASSIAKEIVGAVVGVEVEARARRLLAADGGKAQR